MQTKQAVLTIDDSVRAAAVPLCVDLDGTLLRSDLLVESVLALLATRPWLLLAMPIWLLRGKAAFKREVAARVDVDGEFLPWDSRLVDRLRVERAHRRLVLCTAADADAARRAVAPLAIFDDVLGSDGSHNLAGANKAGALVSRFGEGGFDYVANHRVDLPVWRVARKAWVVNAAPDVCRDTAGACEVELTLPRDAGGWRGWLQALRLHQWLKNLLVFLPLLASHRFTDPDAVLAAIGAFVAFGLCASGVYLLNDLFDLRADRRHPRKRLRPLAAGRLSLLAAGLLSPLLSLSAIVLAWSIRPWFAAVLAAYYASTLAYSLFLKRAAMLDVIVLAGLYTLRIIGGAVAIASALSFWLLAFSMFLFLSLAMLKRYAELHSLLADGRDQASGRGYTVEDLPLIQSLGASAGYLAVLVLALYINSPESVELYSQPRVLWLLCPLLLYWVSRAWVVAHRGRMNDDPVVFAVTDRVSVVTVLLCAIIAFGAI